MIWENLCYLFIILTCILGITTLIQWLLLKTFTPKKRPDAILIVPFSGDGEDMELVLKGAELRARQLGGRLCDRVIAVDCGMSSEAHERCREICLMMGTVELCTPQELQECIMSHVEGRSESERQNADG